jgi:hypothetical protein
MRVVYEKPAKRATVTGRRPPAIFSSRQPELSLTFHIAALLDRARTEGAFAMATQIVMDHSGDTRHYFDANDAKALLEAEERFLKLTGAGFTAAVRTASGEPAVTRRFDPAAGETLFFPRLVGG